MLAVHAARHLHPTVDLDPFATDDAKRMQAHLVVLPAGFRDLEGALDRSLDPLDPEHHDRVGDELFRGMGGVARALARRDLQREESRQLLAMESLREHLE